MSVDDFPGKDFKSGYPIRCEFCKNIATHKGAGMKDGHRRHYSLCIHCAVVAAKDFVISSYEELQEFRAWKKKMEEESRKAHPSSQRHLQLFK